MNETEAQVNERRFWHTYFQDTPPEVVMRSLDYAHQQEYMGFVARTVGFNRPQSRLIEYGCGPCGFAPWIRCQQRDAVEPLRDWFTVQGIDYNQLGYYSVYEDQPQYPHDIALCCNVLDHVYEPESFLKDISRQCSELLLIYDQRLVTTAMHPSAPDSLTVLNVLKSLNWRLLRSRTQPANGGPDHRNEVSSRRFEYWRR